MGLFHKLKEALGKTREGVSGGISKVFSSFVRIDEDFFEELEECLIFADVGMETTMTMMDELRGRVKAEHLKEAEEIKAALREIMVAHLQHELPKETYPLVILMVGVNGVGKTTTIGKIANLYQKQGKTVTIAAADTFRAAAVEQLQEWGKRSGAHVIRHEEGSDPAAVVYDAIASVKAKGTDVLIVDTAGRLHNKKNLMDELEKIKRTIDKNFPEAMKLTLLGLDATTGQNGVNQAELFTQAADVDAVCINKLDGTAKGGVVFGIIDKVGLGVKYVGVGEKVDDIMAFDPQEFVRAILD